MKFVLRILRFNPETDREAVFRDYRLDMDPSDRLLDALLYIKTYIDGSLGVRYSCAHGVCGSDGMVINGVERLACKTLIRDVTGKPPIPATGDAAAEAEGAIVTVEPLRTLPVQRDLMVDQARFFETYRAVKPYQINAEPEPEKERLQPPAERVAFEDPTKCILCACCYSACPVVQKENPAFIGPAAIVNAARFVFDSRDRGFEERLGVLDDPNGVWPCKNYFFCTRVCPRDIKVTKNINLTKRKIESYRKGQA
jgi:succinate dehydrogenase / fumarate reductase iron-sulfur subunit